GAAAALHGKSRKQRHQSQYTNKAHAGPLQGAGGDNQPDMPGKSSQQGTENEGRQTADKEDPHADAVGRPAGQQHGQGGEGDKGRYQPVHRGGSDAEIHHHVGQRDVDKNGGKRGGEYASHHRQGEGQQLAVEAWYFDLRGHWLLSVGQLR